MHSIIKAYKGCQRPTVKPSVDEHGPVEQDGRVTEPWQVSAQVLRDGGLDVVPAVAQDVVDQHVGRVTLGTLRPEVMKG